MQTLGVDGFHFDAAIHVEPEFYSDVLTAVPGALTFGETITDQSSDFSDWLAIEEMDYYDSPLTRTMREAFGFGGDLRILRSPKAEDRALDGPKAITFVRNHDIDRGQNFDRGLDGSDGRRSFGIGWNEGTGSLDRTDVDLAYAFIFGREDGLPYVFVDMPTREVQDDRFDPAIVAGIRSTICALPAMAASPGDPRSGASKRRTPSASSAATIASW